MIDNKVSLLDRLLVIPVAAYFWWYKQLQKITTKSISYASTFVLIGLYGEYYLRLRRSKY